MYFRMYFIMNSYSWFCFPPCCWTNLVCLCCLILHYSPGLPIIAVSHFERCDELDGAKVFCPLCDNSSYPFGRL